MNHPQPNSQRVPPQNDDAEKALLGAMLLSEYAISDSVGVAATDHFYRARHQHIHQAITALYAAGEPVDPVTVAAELERFGLTEGTGLEYLHELQLSTPATSTARKYARIVKEQHVLRQLISTGSEIAELGYGQPADVYATLDEAETKVMQIAERDSEETLQNQAVFGEEALDVFVERQQSKSLAGTPTGFVDLDTKLSGFKPGQLVVIGARPAMGKTSFMLNIAANVAYREKLPVVLFSLEMNRHEISWRLFGAETRINTKAISDGRVEKAEAVKIVDFVENYRDAPLWIDDNPMPNILEIRSKARRVKQQAGGLALVIVDYIQLIASRGSKAETRAIEVAEMSRGLKTLAGQLKCPVIGVSQLSRNLESRNDKRPILSDLRESGSIEQDADVVLFLYRDEVYNPQDNPNGLAEVIIAKNRTGPIGTIELNWLPRFTLFTSHTDRGEF